MDLYAKTFHRYALVICRNHENKYLAIKETMNRGWWIPAGKVHTNQTFLEAARRQCFEETNIDLDIKGIMRIDYGKYYSQDIWRCIFYAEPKFQHSLPKQVSDEHSLQAKFLTLKQIQSLESEWRGSEIYDFPKILEDGGNIYPLEVLRENYNRTTDTKS